MTGVYRVELQHFTRKAPVFAVFDLFIDIDDFRRINLSDVAHASRSTSARVIGAYFSLGINAALTKPSTSNSLIEDLLRQ